jgi:hypothetical protein
MLWIQSQEVKLKPWFFLLHCCDFGGNIQPFLASVFLCITQGQNIKFRKLLEGPFNITCAKAFYSTLTYKVLKQFNVYL